MRRIIDARALSAARGAGSPRAAHAWLHAALVIAWGVAAAFVYASQGLTLSHYDAKGHLVVARRVIDSLTPGWQQIGAVWLPLPHLLNLLPVQVDAFYRTGASGVAISIASLGLAAWSLARLVLAVSGSMLAASAGVLLLAVNPNLLYLQSTPMTEPLLIGLLLYSTWRAYLWAADRGAGRARTGLALAAACWTRYEAWPFTVAVVVLGAVARWRQGEPLRVVLRGTSALTAYPVVAILLFLVNSKVTVGAWFVTGGFYVPDPAMQGKPLAVTSAVWWGGRQLGSDALMVGAAILAAWLAWTAWRRLPAALVPLALLAVAALPWYAFFQGHPFRIRYMVPLVAAAVTCASLGAGLLRGRVRAAIVAALVIGVLAQARPFDPGAPMVLEAQWDRPNSAARRHVARCLAAGYRGESVMASMGSLAHFMQELSWDGFELRDFVHEGNGDIWLGAFRGRPADTVGWLLIEERAEGGDMLAARAASDERFLAGFTRACAGGGVALYRAGWIDRPRQNRN